jgi:hypothetical protein
VAVVLGETLHNRISAFGNGARKLNSKLLLMGLSAVLGFCKASSQTDSNPTQFDHWPTINEILALDKTLKIDTVILDHPDPEFLHKFSPAHYDARKNELVIGLHIPAKNYGFGMSETDRALLANGYGLKYMCDLLNESVPVQYIHEDGHRLVANHVNVHGLSVDELAKEMMHEEIAMRIRELLFRRGIFLRSGSAEQAFKGEPRRHTSQYIDTSCFRYERWISNNSKNMKAAPSEREWEVILDAALDDFQESFPMYAQSIPNVVKYKIRKLNGVYNCYFNVDKRAGNKENLNGYDSAVFEIYRTAGMPEFDVNLRMVKINKKIKSLQSEREFRHRINALKKEFADFDAMAKAFFVENALDLKITKERER